MTGWRREMTWFDTGLAWVRPSPNLRTAEAALAYPGVARLEATNVAEGRGTEAPFLILGAPWLDAAALAAALSVPGFSFEVTRFTPRASAAAPEPKYRDRDCAGLRVHVVDAPRADPDALGRALLAALARQPGFEWRESGAALRRLLGTSHPAADDARTVRQWTAARRAALLY